MPGVSIEAGSFRDPGGPTFEGSGTTAPLTYGYGYNPGAKGFLFPMQEWLASGDPYSAESWQQGMRYYPAGANNQ